MSNVDPSVWAVVVGSIASVGSLGWTVRISQRRDHRDKDAADAKAVQIQIDAAIKADRDRQDAERRNKALAQRDRELAAANAKIADLEKHQRDAT